MTEISKEVKGLRLKHKKSRKENFYIHDTIGVPHPYCITPRHVSVASDDHAGMLGENAIRDAEMKGATCGVSGCNLSYGKHEQAILIGCKNDIDGNDELHEYLLAIKERGVGKYAGFAFLDLREKDEE